VNKYIELAIVRLGEGDEASTAWSLISIAQSLERIAVAQERLADNLRDVNLKKSLDEIEYTLKHR
jgi:hypothetical protein